MLDFIPKPLLRAFGAKHIDVRKKQPDDIVDVSQTIIRELDRSAKERAGGRRINPTCAHTRTQIARPSSTLQLSKQRTVSFVSDQGLHVSRRLVLVILLRPSREFVRDRNVLTILHLRR